MKIHWCSGLLATAVLLGVMETHAQQPKKPARAAADSAKAAFEFAGVGYFYRWSENQQHEFTPRGQEDLTKWADMVTVNGYPAVHDAEALATRANMVLDNYRGHGARVLRTDSLPAKADRPAEHFIAVLFAQPQFVELAFARFRLADGTGCSLVYSHRIYGEKAGDEASAWLEANGPKMEKALMKWSTMPAPAALTRDLR